jgi:sugar-phosphatase
MACTSVSQRRRGLEMGAYTASRVFHVAGILFDNDGVLVDSNDTAAVVWNQWASRWAPHFDFHRDIEHGRRITDIVTELVTTEHVAEATQNLIDMEIRLATSVTAIAGAPELTAGSPHDSWAVVTSGTRAIALARLRAAAIPLPREIISADDIVLGKPAPEPYLAGAARLGLPACRCAVFEDAPAGILSARSAGIAHVIGVGSGTFGHDVDVTISSLKGITFDGHTLTIPEELVIDDG